MPLALTSGQALLNLRGNSTARWPTRDIPDNRVEPIATPAFKAAFKFSKEDKVFTIGSCFARNVERSLEQLGYDVPMRRLQLFPEAGETPDDQVSMMNNYSVPSILNELQWALDPEHPFDPRTGLFELSPNGFHDLHLARMIPPVPFAVAHERRERIAATIATVRDCRIVIVTLGLVEVWWDTLARRYLNVAPPRLAMKNAPDRFQLHVMNYDDVASCLRQIFGLLKAHCRDDLRVLLTVSPVPLNTTFTEQDVLVANTYSKSVLRAAAQEIVWTHPFVDYFPSYESFVLSDRKVAFDMDMRHPTEDLVAINIARMVSAYVDTGKAVSEKTLLEAQTAEKGRRIDIALPLYQSLLEDQNVSGQARIGYASCICESGRAAEALELVKPLLFDQHLQTSASLAFMKICRLHKLKDEFLSFLPHLEQIKTRQILRELIAATFLFRMYEGCTKFCETLKVVEPHLAYAIEMLGRIAKAQGRLEDAADLFWLAAQKKQVSPGVFVCLGQVHLELGRTAGAEEAFRKALSLSPGSKPARDGLSACRARLDAPSGMPAA